MQHTYKSKKAFGLAALCTLMTWGTILGAAAQTRTVALDAGAVIPVKLDDALSSKSARTGDSFTATIRNDADAEYYRLPTGTRVEGVVREVRPQKDKDPGVLDLEFRRLRLPDGHSYSIQGSLIGLDNKSVEKRSDGRLVAKPGHRNDRLTYVGYGAGAGLVVGLLTKHALEDTAIGGGLGYLFGALQKGSSSQPRDVALKQGTELGVRLDRQVTLANYGSREDYDNYRSRNDDSGRFHRSQESRSQANSDSNYQYRQDERNNQNNRVSEGSRDTIHSRVNATDIGMLIGSRNVTFASTARPFMSKGVVMVPARAALDAAHIPFTYDTPNQELRATGDKGTVRLALNSSIAVWDGRRERVSAPAQRLNGTLYVPMQFLSLVTGRDVTYDAGSRTIVMDQPDRRSDNTR